ncbi:hypothetical protein AVEN_141034-1 [Araneus ventricosus]|uniref:Uncharacterized protein n=1 Tax=Araneus ventricosus TaxID=182803 RepID=A0A4Y2UEW1_ARAVE|nr:hypothetical protein AVEN_141034-1 [Araneus ventricosus]
MTESWESDLSVSEKEALDQLKARMSADMIQELHNDTYHIYLFLKDNGLQSCHRKPSRFQNKKKCVDKSPE